MPDAPISPDFRDASTMPDDAVLAVFGVDPRRGLTAAEAATRRGSFGANETTRERVSAFAILKRQLLAPFSILLAVAAAASAATGEPTDALMILFFIAVNATIGFVQEHRAAIAVASLMRYWEEKARAVRAGAPTVVPAKDLVPGDIVLLQAGDKIPADLRLLSARSLTVDESTLTGESIATRKSAGPMEASARDTFDAINAAFAGCTVLTGEATGVVLATGARTATGAAIQLATDTEKPSAFDREIAAFSTVLLRLTVGTLATLFAAHVLLHGWDRAGEILLFAIALTVGVVPEALPTVSAIALSLGARRLARKHVIVKRLSAINDLGSIDVLCTDKTGTLTQNSLAVANVRAADADECVRLATLGSSFVGETARGQNNAFDLALWKHASATTRAACAKAEKLEEAPFDPSRRRNAVLTRVEGGTTLVVRGAPEEVLPLCTDIPDQIALGRHLATEGLQGRRTLAIAVKRDVPADADPASEEHGLTFVGVISFHDPLKPDAKAAVQRAKRLGVRVTILTGDSREVSGATARALDLIDDPAMVMTGAEFDALEPGAQVEAVRTHQVFARMNPRQKFAVLALLRETHTVGFLGEGFNDAPGLKMAHVGIAVDGASDAAKESASIVLLSNGLHVLCDGIEEGRRTFSNTVKYLRTTLAGNLGNFFAVAASSFFIPFLPMRPTQILLVNLLTDLPMVAIATDTTDAAELRKPKRYDMRAIVSASLVFGLVSTAFDLATFAIFRMYGETTLQTAWFTVSVLTELTLILSMRTERPFWRVAHPPLLISSLTWAAIAIAVFLPMSAFGAKAFGFASLPFSHALSVLVIVALYFVATEAVKMAVARPERA